MSEWAFLRMGFAVVGLLVVAALVGWAIEAARYEDRGFQKLVSCLVEKEGATLAATHDPIARSAELGAVDTVIETNPVTISVAGDQEGAERIVSNYRAVGGGLGPRLELRGRTVYLWGRAPSPTQRQAVFDCTY